MPSSHAWARPWSAPPQSRTVVKPRSSMPLRMGTARAYSRLGGIVLGMRRLALLAVTCTWLSMSPGINVKSRQSRCCGPSKGCEWPTSNFTWSMTSPVTTTHILRGNFGPCRYVNRSLLTSTPGWCSSPKSPARSLLFRFLSSARSPWSLSTTRMRPAVITSWRGPTPARGASPAEAMAGTRTRVRRAPEVSACLGQSREKRKVAFLQRKGFNPARAPCPRACLSGDSGCEETSPREARIDRRR